VAKAATVASIVRLAGLPQGAVPRVLRAKLVDLVMSRVKIAKNAKMASIVTVPCWIPRNASTVHLDSTNRKPGPPFAWAVMQVLMPTKRVPRSVKRVLWVNLLVRNGPKPWTRVLIVPKILYTTRPIPNALILVHWQELEVYLPNPNKKLKMAFTNPKLK
jgi:hypothetical protein